MSRQALYIYIERERERERDIDIDIYIDNRVLIDRYLFTQITW